MITVINHSTRLTDPAAVQAMVAAVRTQIHTHVAPLWNITPPAVIAGPSVKIADRAKDWPIIILDNADQANALGYHDETPDGRPYGRVFVAPVLDSGGTVLSGANSVSAVLSHECCETAVDPHVNLWAIDTRGTLWALESADTVEADSYQIDGISVSNFVLPSAFDPQGHKPFDYMKLTHAPFQIRPGGYAITMQGGTVQEVFGAAYPRHKLAEKQFPASRTYRRLHRRPA